MATSWKKEEAQRYASDIAYEEWKKKRGQKVLSMETKKTHTKDVFDGIVSQAVN